MFNFLKHRKLDLQLFAEGGGTATGGTADGGVATAEGVSPSEITYGKQTEAHDAGVQNNSEADRVKAFEDMIKGEYKDLYDARVQDTVKNRLKSTKDTVDRYNKLTPILEMLGTKYGVDASDVDALNAAIQEDDSYYEDEALDRGISVEQLKSIKRMERENADLKAQMDEARQRENADRIYAGWMEESEQLKSIYPNFDLQSELDNPEFVNLLRGNVGVRTAYEVIHKDEVMPAYMAQVAKDTEKKITNKIMAGAKRPAENGTNAQSSAIVKSDVSQLTKADREEIARRVARGERIVF